MIVRYVSWGLVTTAVRRTLRDNYVHSGRGQRQIRACVNISILGCGAAAPRMAGPRSTAAEARSMGYLRKAYDLASKVQKSIQEARERC